MEIPGMPNNTTRNLKQEIISWALMDQATMKELRSQSNKMDSFRSSAVRSNGVQFKSA